MVSRTVIGNSSTAITPQISKIGLFSQRFVEHSQARRTVVFGSRPSNMAVAAPVRSIAEFTLNLNYGPVIVYLDISIGDQPPRRIRIELFDEELPYTSGNFRMLCTGERKGTTRARALFYKQTRFHRIIPGFMMQGGDITHGNGVGGASAYSRIFEDESFLYKHQLGSVSMAHQNHSNKSQFFICFTPASWCDGKHVVFGQVLAEDLAHLAAFEALGSASGRPLAPVVVADCGQLSGDGYISSPPIPPSPSTVTTIPT